MNRYFFFAIFVLVASCKHDGPSQSGLLESEVAANDFKLGETEDLCNIFGRTYPGLADNVIELTKQTPAFLDNDQRDCLGGYFHFMRYKLPKRPTTSIVLYNLETRSVVAELPSLPYQWDVPTVDIPADVSGIKPEGCDGIDFLGDVIACFARIDGRIIDHQNGQPHGITTYAYKIRLYSSMTMQPITEFQTVLKAQNFGGVSSPYAQRTESKKFVLINENNTDRVTVWNRETNEIKLGLDLATAKGIIAEPLLPFSPVFEFETSGENAAFSWKRDPDFINYNTHASLTIKHK